MNLSQRQRALAALLIGVVGVAQMFRSPTEMFIGAGYIAAATMLVVARHTAYLIGVAYSFVGVMFGARALSGLWVSTAWHGTVIIVCTWGGLSLAFARVGWRIMNGRNT